MAGFGTVNAAAFPLLKLPSELQQKIFSFHSYDEVSRCRLVCKAVDTICQKILNGGFSRVERFQAQSLYRVKTQLPRRESERRTHELARHADILTSIETRLSLLSMTYGKYMDSSLCCFIPGKVLDEMFRVLRIVNNTPRGDQPPRPHELLQELRDISSMAMEHFEEHIVPFLRGRITLSPVAASNPAASSLSTSALVLYAAASGSPPLLNVAGLSAVPKTTICTVPHQHLSFTSTCRGLRSQGDVLCSMTRSTQGVDGLQNQRYNVLKRQYQVQRCELATYKRQLAQFRAIQQRQKDKMNEMERRLNEHEQLFVDIMAQLRGSGLANASHSGNSGVPVSTSEPRASTGAGAKRKRIAQNSVEVSASESVTVKKLAAARSAKRQKMDD